MGQSLCADPTLHSALKAQVVEAPSPHKAQASAAAPDFGQPEPKRATLRGIARRRTRLQSVEEAVFHTAPAPETENSKESPEVHFFDTAPAAPVATDHGSADQRPQDHGPEDPAASPRKQEAAEPQAKPSAREGVLAHAAVITNEAREVVQGSWASVHEALDKQLAWWVGRGLEITDAKFEAVSAASEARDSGQLLLRLNEFGEEAGVDELRQAVQAVSLAEERYIVLSELKAALRRADVDDIELWLEEANRLREDVRPERRYCKNLRKRLTKWAGKTDQSALLQSWSGDVRAEVQEEQARPSPNPVRLPSEAFANAHQGASSDGEDEVGPGIARADTPVEEGGWERLAANRADDPECDDGAGEASVDDGGALASHLWEELEMAIAEGDVLFGLEVISHLESLAALDPISADAARAQMRAAGGAEDISSPSAGGLSPAAAETLSPRLGDGGRREGPAGPTRQRPVSATAAAVQQAKRQQAAQEGRPAPGTTPCFSPSRPPQRLPPDRPTAQSGSALPVPIYRSLGAAAAAAAAAAVGKGRGPVNAEVDWAAERITSVPKDATAKGLVPQSAPHSVVWRKNHRPSALKRQVRMQTVSSFHTMRSSGMGRVNSLPERTQASQQPAARRQSTYAWTTSSSPPPRVQRQAPASGQRTRKEQIPRNVWESSSSESSPPPSPRTGVATARGGFSPGAAAKAQPPRSPSHQGQPYLRRGGSAPDFAPNPPRGVSVGEEAPQAHDFSTTRAAQAWAGRTKPRTPGGRPAVPKGPSGGTQGSPTAGRVSAASTPKSAPASPADSPQHHARYESTRPVPGATRHVGSSPKSMPTPTHTGSSPKSMPTPTPPPPPPPKPPPQPAAPKPRPTGAEQVALGVLNLQVDFTDSDLRAAYKQAALRWHPDRPAWRLGSEQERQNATEKFQQAKDAYDLLSGKPSRPAR